VLDRIAALLAGHGVQTTRRGEWLVPVQPAGAAIGACLVPGTPTAHGASVRLEVEVVVSEQHSVLECFAGVGGSLEEAESSALDNFCRGSLHVLLAAFYGRPDLDQITQEGWSLSGVPYDAIVGNYVTRSFQGLGTPIPDQVFPTLEDMIRALPGDRALYWVRMFYCNLDANERVTEVLLNNEDWEAARSAIAALPWQARDTFYSARLFLVLRRGAGAVA
jgi:Family of unknown function (DUF6348)